MSQHFNLQIPGAQSDDGQIEVTAPYDGTLIATVTAADADAVDWPFPPQIDCTEIVISG